MTKRLTTEDFVKKAKKIHGEKYNYSLVQYVNNYTKITIICPNHGNFEQRPYSHLRGAGCCLCGNASHASLISSNAEQFIEKANKAHKNKYDYDKVKYINVRSKVTIVCKIHGEFEQTPANHLSGNGCPKCGTASMASLHSSDIEEFIEKAEKVHGCRYNYDEVAYVSSNSKVIITCKIHRNFEQTPNVHLSGAGCKNCADASLLSSTEQFIEKAKKIHKNKYRYSSVKYINAKSKVTIICPLHGPFAQTPDGHLSGKGCSACAPYGYKKDRPGVLYYLSVNKGKAFKIGITNISVHKRYTNSELEKIEILFEYQYEDGAEAQKTEQRLLQKYKQHKYDGEALLKSGNTELFNMDIFHGDYSYETVREILN